MTFVVSNESADEKITVWVQRLILITIMQILVNTRP